MIYKLFHFFFTLCIGHCNFLCKKKDDSDQEEDEVVVRPLEAETISFSFIGQVFYTMASIFPQDQQHSTTMRPF